MKKAALLAIVVLVIGIVAASCGGSGAGGGAVKITKDELINGVTASTEQASTYRFKMHIVLNEKGTSGGESGEVNLNYDSTGAFDKVDQEMQMDMNMSGSFKGAGEPEQMTGRMRIYWLGDTFYVGTQEDGSPEVWVKSDETETLRQSEDLMSQYVEIVRGADVKILGLEEVEGVTCYVAEIYPDMGKLLDLLGSQLGSNMPIPLTEDSIGNFLCKGWYAQDTFFPMKGYQEYDLNLEEGSDKLTGDVTASILLYDYNKPVSINLPPEAKQAK